MDKDESKDRVEVCTARLEIFKAMNSLEKVKDGLYKLKPLDSNIGMSDYISILKAINVMIGTILKLIEKGDTNDDKMEMTEQQYLFSLVDILNILNMEEKRLEALHDHCTISGFSVEMHSNTLKSIRILLENFMTSENIGEYIDRMIEGKYNDSNK